MNDIDTKPWWQSRVVWFNVIAVLLGFLELQSQTLKGLLHPAVYEWLILLLPLGNMLLRMDTHTALTLRRDAPTVPTPKEGPKP